MLFRSPAVMAAWPASDGEAIHTSTFLGNPVTCAAAVAQLDEIEGRGLVTRAAELGAWMDHRLQELVANYPAALGTRGLGLMRALALPDVDTAARLAAGALRAGVIVLPEGAALAFTPPLIITEAQLGHAVDVLAELVADVDA